MGRGRGGAGAGAAGAGAMQMNPAMMMGMMPMMQQQQQQQVNNNQPTVFLSVAQLADDVPLQHLFTLMEAFGGVVAIRRNHNRPTIATVKMASIAEADLVIQYMRHVPLGANNTVGAKRFPTYTGATRTGRATHLSLTLQYDFTTSRLQPQQRSKPSVPSKFSVSPTVRPPQADLMQFFTEKNFFPARHSRRRRIPRPHGLDRQYREAPVSARAMCAMNKIQRHLRRGPSGCCGGCPLVRLLQSQPVVQRQ